MWRLYIVIVLLNAGDVWATATEWHHFGPGVEGNPLIPHSVGALVMIKIYACAGLGAVVMCAKPSRLLRVSMVGLVVVFTALMAWHVAFLGGHL